LKAVRVAGCLALHNYHALSGGQVDLWPRVLPNAEQITTLSKS
jgi:hypothetical protein